jgi:hypothetical protein
VTVDDACNFRQDKFILCGCLRQIWISKAGSPVRSPNRPQDRGLEARDRQIMGKCGVELILDAIGRDSLKKGHQQRAVFRQRGDLVRGFGSTRRTRLANGDR